MFSSKSRELEASEDSDDANDETDEQLLSNSRSYKTDTSNRLKKLYNKYKRERSSDVKSKQRYFLEDEFEI
jgi:protein subunit release factor B